MTDQLTGILRAILGAIGGYFVAKGMVSADTVNWAIGGALVAIPAAWSWWSNRPAAIAAKAQSIDGVNVQTTASAPPAVKTAVANVKSSGG